MRPIVGRQAIAQLVGPEGPIVVGQWEEVRVREEVESEDLTPIDGSHVYVVIGRRFSGSLSRGYYDANLAGAIWKNLYPNSSDPPRLVLLVTERFNDGKVRQTLYKEVLLTSRERSITRGIIKESLDWQAEEAEEL